MFRSSLGPRFLRLDASFGIVAISDPARFRNFPAGCSEAAIDTVFMWALAKMQPPSAGTIQGSSTVGRADAGFTDDRLHIVG